MFFMCCVSRAGASHVRVGGGGRPGAVEQPREMAPCWPAQRRRRRRAAVRQHLRHSTPTPRPCRPTRPAHLDDLLSGGRRRGAHRRHLHLLVPLVGPVRGGAGGQWSREGKEGRWGREPRAARWRGDAAPGSRCGRAARPPLSAPQLVARHCPPHLRVVPLGSAPRAISPSPPSPIRNSTPSPSLQGEQGRGEGGRAGTRGT